MVARRPGPRQRVNLGLDLVVVLTLALGGVHGLVGAVDHRALGARQAPAAFGDEAHRAAGIEAEFRDLGPGAGPVLFVTILAGAKPR